MAGAGCHMSEILIGKRSYLTELCGLLMRFACDADCLL